MSESRLARAVRLVSVATAVVSALSVALSVAACTWLGKRFYCAMALLWLAPLWYAVTSYLELSRGRGEEPVEASAPPDR